MTRVVRGIRFDFAIAMCALLISTVAAGASWYQTRLLRAQTEVLQEQLGAQVWPYISVDEGIRSDTVDIRFPNDGLGPAILRSLSAAVDGTPRSGFIEILHALLGPHLVERKPHGEKLGLTIDIGDPGSVIRSGESNFGFTFTSKHFAPLLFKRSRRLKFRVCYCSIVPGKCWLRDYAATGEAKPVDSCPEIANDLLHLSAIDEITNRNF